MEWARFEEELSRCFGDLKVANMVEEFNKLKQEGNIMEYQEIFEELR